MSLPNKKNELNGTRPDRMATAILVIGLVMACSFILYGVIYFILGGWPLLPYIPPLIFLGGIGIIYGAVRTVRGNSATKQLVKATLIKIRNGTIAGSAVAFVVLQIALASSNHDSWYNWFNGFIPSLFVVIPGALIFGISAGSIGGMILGSKWKNKKAVFVGGAIAGGIMSFLYLLIAF
jgi:hypothetical protein